MYRNTTRSHPLFSFVQLATPKRLGIYDDEVDVLSWGEVVERLIAFHSQCPLGPFHLTPIDIANRIMRKCCPPHLNKQWISFLFLFFFDNWLRSLCCRDNYLIAMINRNILDLSVPLPFGNLRLLTHSMELNLRLIILENMFDRNQRVRTRFIHDVPGLRRRMILAGLLNLVLCPFILAALLNYLFLRYAENVRYSHEALSKRQYSLLAQWQLREFNEVRAL